MFEGVKGQVQSEKTTTLKMPVHNLVELTLPDESLFRSRPEFSLLHRLHLSSSRVREFGTKRKRSSAFDGRRMKTEKRVMFDAGFPQNFTRTVGDDVETQKRIVAFSLLTSVQDIHRHQSNNANADIYGNQLPNVYT